MEYGNTAIEVEEYKDCFIFYVDYNVPEDLDDVMVSKAQKIIDDINAGGVY